MTPIDIVTLSLAISGFCANEVGNKLLVNKNLSNQFLSHIPSSIEGKVSQHLRINAWSQEHLAVNAAEKYVEKYCFKHFRKF